MRASGGGGSDTLMTTVPLGILVIFVVFMFGGPAAFMKTSEAMLRSLVEWFATMFR